MTETVVEWVCREREGAVVVAAFERVAGRSTVVKRQHRSTRRPAFEHLAAHVASLGGVRGGTPIDVDVLGVRGPDSLRWWDEIRDAIDSFDMPAGAVPFHDDQCGGLLVAMPDGRVTQLVPDSPIEVLSHFAPSFEAFLMSLRRGE